MSEPAYSYKINDEESMPSVEETLLLAVIAAEGLHGRSKINMDASFRLIEKDRVCEIDVGNDVGADIARIFTALLTITLGEQAFKVERQHKEGV